MTTLTPSRTSRGALWLSYILSGLPILFLLFDAFGKLLTPQPVIEASTALGISEAQIPLLGLILLPCLVLYTLPRTAVFGAVLLTGYLGGVEATHMLAGSSIDSFIFPVILGALLWGGLYLRNTKLREVVPIQR